MGVPRELVIWTNEQIRAATPGQLLQYTSYAKRQKWRRDPALWMKERLHEEPWSKQVEIIESVRDNRHTASPAGFDLGKSFIASRAACWWIDTADPDETIYVVTTAPTKAQVKGILWREISIAHKKGNLVGKVHSLVWKRGGTEVGIGIKPSDYGTGDFQGYHADRVLVILDEAAGVKEKFWEGADGIAANDDSRVLAIGNPEEASAKFGRVCDPNHKEGKKWFVVRITAYDSPKVTGEPVSEKVLKNLVGPTWIAEKAEEWGEESPMFLSKVLAQFVKDIRMGVVPFQWMINNCRRDEDAVVTDDGPVELGVDCGAGGDLSVIQERIGPRAGRQWDSQHDDPQQLVGEIMAAIIETGATAVKIDGIGIGWSIAGWLEEKIEEMGLECVVHVVDVRNTSHEPHKFFNLRSEIWWEVGRELSRTRGWDLTDLYRNDDPDLQKKGEQTINELCEPKYRNDSSGRIKVEPKEDTIKRLGHSPDRADALLLAFYVPPPEGLFFLGSV